MNTRRKLLNLIATVFVSGSMLLTAVPVSAAGASIYLTANHSTLSDGSTLIVAVYMNGGGNPINAVEADLNYSASKLQYVGLNYSGGAFNISTPGDGGGNGTVSIQNGAISPVSGNGLIATVTFRALVGSGSATIGVSGTSNLISASTNTPVAFGSTGVTVNFGSAAPPSSSSSSHSSAPAAATPPPPPKDTTPPVISDIKVTDLSPFGATVTWTTNEASSSEVDYGLDATYGLSSSSTALTTTHAVALSSAFLTPETVFHYHVKSADASGNVAVSPDEHFGLPGVPVTVVVVGANGKPEANATVTLDGATSTTDSKGRVTLPSSLGNKKITTTYQGVTVQKPITVDRTVRPLSPYQLDLARQPLNHWMLTSIGLFIMVLVLLGIDALLFGSHFFGRLAGLRLASAALLPHRRSTGPATADTVPAALPATTSDSRATTEPANPIVKTPVSEPEEAKTQLDSSTAAPAAETGFNVHTTGDNSTPPTLRAIDNIQPLSLRPSFAPSAASAAAPPKRIAITETVSDDHTPVTSGVVTSANTANSVKLTTKKKQVVRKHRKKVTKKLAAASPTPDLAASESPKP